VALIIVMVMVMILTINAGFFAYAMKIETRLAMNARSFSELEWLGRSGMEQAKWILAEDMKIEPRDTENDIWAGGDGGLTASNSPIGEIRLPLTVNLGKGSYTLHRMTDNESKININQADRVLLEQVLRAMGADASEIPVVAGSILDWIDRDDMENMQGAESDYYMGFDPPYEAKNGPMDDLSELLLIQGVHPLMYQGSGSGTFLLERDRSTGRARFREGEGPIYAFGLVDVFTTISSGRLNGFTVSEETLSVLPGMDDFLASQYVDMRRGVDGLDGTMDDVLPDWSFIQPDPAARARLQGLMDQRSTTFEVRVTARVGGVSRDFLGVIVRNNPNDVQLVSFSAAESLGGGGDDPDDLAAFP
jgi:general secretion pathway protein K